MPRVAGCSVLAVQEREQPGEIVVDQPGPRVFRTDLRLADGRTLRYYDRSPGHDRSALDQRELASVASASEARFDPALGEWVVVASHRQSRTFLPADEDCPLCPTTPTRSTEIPAPDYEVVVFDNRFPSLVAPAGAPPSPAASPDDPSPVGYAVPGWGRCEVVCFTSDHDSSFAALSVAQVETVLAAWQDRTAELSALPEVEQVFVFENCGVEIGVTLSHPHGQIYAYPFQPPRVRRQLDAARRHRARHGSCLWCDLVGAELAERRRIVRESEHWVALVPFASRWPFQVQLYPRRHVADLATLDEAESRDLAVAYLDVIRRFSRLFSTPAPYIAGWQQAPTGEGRELGHLFAEVLTVRRAEGKLKYLAGSESGMGVFVNDVTPERAAARLREVGSGF